VLLFPNAIAVSTAEAREYKFAVNGRHQWVTAIMSQCRSRL
jgi:hypothetical protein